MIATIGLERHFDASHFLPNYEGKCANVHGHTWTLTVSITGKVDEQNGMVLDFTILKPLVDKAINKVDHKSLNDILAMPTCELLTKWFHGQIWPKIRQYPNIQTLGIELQEGQGGWAYFEG